MNDSFGTWVSELPSKNQEVLFWNEKSFTLSDLMNAKSDLSISSHKYKGMGIALRLESPFLFLQALLALDGLAARILILSPTLPSEAHDLFLQEARVTYVFSDLNDCFSVSEIGRTNMEELAEQRHTEWIITTSGTTGTPKLVGHSFKSLTSSVKRSGPESSVVWGLLYDKTRFAGLQVLLQAVLGQNSTVVPNSLSDLGECLCLFVQKGVNCLSATPTLWRKLLMLREIDNLNLRQITLGGEIADSAILNSIAKYFPKARLIHIYASTEAGVGFSVKDGLPGFPANYLSHPPKGVEIKINEEGILCIRKSQNDTRYLNHEIPISDQCGFVNTYDVVERLGDRVFFKGRANGSINVGGSKVYPGEIEAVLRNIEGVQDALVYAKKNSFVGNLVAAKVVALTNYDEVNLKSKIIEECHKSLQSFQIPRFITFQKTLNVTETGKLQRTNQ